MGTCCATAIERPPPKRRSQLAATLQQPLATRRNSENVFSFAVKTSPTFSDPYCARSEVFHTVELGTSSKDSGTAESALTLALKKSPKTID